jgi:hypothetical protein
MRPPGLSFVIFVSFTSFIPLLAPTVVAASVAGRYTYHPLTPVVKKIPVPIPTTLPGSPSSILPRSLIGHDNETKGDGADSTAASEVTHMNMFWVLFTFIFAYVIHPLSGTIGLGSDYRFHALIIPPGPIFDVLYLLCDVFYPPTHSCIHAAPPDIPGEGPYFVSHSDTELRLNVRQAIQLVICRRLNLPLRSLPLPAVPNNDINPTTKRWSGKIISLRAFLSLVSVLQFVKVCGYSHTRWGLVWTVVVFMPWLALEALILIFNDGGLSLPLPKSNLCLCEMGWVSHSDRKKSLIRNAFLVTVVVLNFCFGCSLLDLIVDTLPRKDVPKSVTRLLSFIVVAAMLRGGTIASWWWAGVDLHEFRGIIPVKPTFRFITYSSVVWQVVILVWFFFVYDLSGSSKAAWTESLP